MTNQPHNPPTSRLPLVGITLDAEQLPTRVRLSASHAYADRVAQSGAIPIMLPPITDHVERHAQYCDAFVLTGGDDPHTEPFGHPTHAEAIPILPIRQEYETALLERLATHHPDKPVLGVCLGMQMMALVAGGRLNQHLPDTHKNAGEHWDASHKITPATNLPSSAPIPAPTIEPGQVHSRHRQAVDDPGSMTVLARAHDGVIEAIADLGRPFYLGVQWHPERTKSPSLGLNLFRQLVGLVR